jgi:hypothetical protein
VESSKSLSTISSHVSLAFVWHRILRSEWLLVNGKWEIFQLYQEEFEDTKGVIRIRKSKKDRQHNGQKKKDKRTNNDLQNITQKTKDRVTLFNEMMTMYVLYYRPTRWVVFLYPMLADRNTCTPTHYFDSDPSEPE